MRVGRHQKYVTLSQAPTESNDSDGFFEDLDPLEWWCSIEPSPVGSNEGRATFHIVQGRYRPDITMDTRIVYADPVVGRDRELFVKGVQNISERNVELRLLCEEITP